MATIPLSGYSLQDVINITGGASLSAAFANANSVYFDPAYSGNKDNLLNFRNYNTSRIGLLTQLSAVWEMNELTADTVMVDSSVNGRNGTMNNMPHQVAGKMGYCYYSSNISSKVTVPDYVGFNPFINFSINTWIKWNTALSLINSTNVILSKGELATDGQEYALMLKGGTIYKGLLFSFRDNTLVENLTPTTDKTSTLTNGSWHMITAVVNINGPNNIQLFIDGASVATVTRTSNPIPSTSKPLIIGQYASGNYPLLSYIDQTAIWSKPLTQTEITALYNSGNGLPSSNW